MIVVSAVCSILFLMAVLINVFMARKRTFLSWAFLVVLPFFPTAAGYVAHVAAGSFWTGQTLLEIPNGRTTVRYAGVYDTLSRNVDGVRGIGVVGAVKGLHGLKGMYALVDKIEVRDRVMSSRPKWFFCAPLPDSLVEDGDGVYCMESDEGSAMGADVVMNREVFNIFGAAFVTDSLSIDGKVAAWRKNTVWRGTFYFGFLPFFSGLTDSVDQSGVNDAVEAAGSLGRMIMEAEERFSSIIPATVVVDTAMPAIPSLDDTVFD